MWLNMLFDLQGASSTESDHPMEQQKSKKVLGKILYKTQRVKNQNYFENFDLLQLQKKLSNAIQGVYSNRAYPRQKEAIALVHFFGLIPMQLVRQQLHQNLLKANSPKRQMQFHKLWSKKEKPIKLEAYSYGKCSRSISKNYSIYLYL